MCKNYHMRKCLMKNGEKKCNSLFGKNNSSESNSNFLSKLKDFLILLYLLEDIFLNSLFITTKFFSCEIKQHFNVASNIFKRISV